MPYSYSTFAQLKTQLALRLSDANKTFWTDAELGLWLNESVRLFSACSAFWRDRGTFNTSANTAFYTLGTVLKNGSGELIRAASVTDRSIIQQIQFALLESTASQTSWTGTAMFSYSDVANAVQNRLNQFHSDTGLGTQRVIVNVASPPIGRQVLDQSVIDVRRVAWQGAPPENYFTVLWREDERLLTAADQGWSVNPGAPEAYSIMAPPPLTLQIAPIPQTSGSLELFATYSTSINPASSPTVLPVPDDLSAAIKWGALSDLLGKDGEARDPIRAAYCEQIYQLYVRLGRVIPVIIHAEINGTPLIPVTLQEMDSYNPNWENIRADASNPVQDLIMISTGFIGLSAVPDQAYSVTLDVVRRAPIYNDGDLIQLGREQLDMILDYAEHVALFKVGGKEWDATARQAKNFIDQSLVYNQRLSAAARASISAGQQTQRQKQGVPRRLNTVMGLGALTDAGS